MKQIHDLDGYQSYLILYSFYMFINNLTIPNGSASKWHAIPTPSNKNNSISKRSLSWNKNNQSIQNNNENIFMTTQVGTIAFMAPELLNKIGNVGGKRGLCYGSKQVML